MKEEKWEQRERRWEQHRKDVGGPTHMVDVGKEGGVGGGKGCVGGVDGRVEERAGYCWVVKEGVSRWLW